MTALEAENYRLTKKNNLTKQDRELLAENQKDLKRYPELHK